MSDILLDVKNLNIVYSTSDGVVYALNDANLQIKRGETLGLVGETGAGSHRTGAGKHGKGTAGSNRGKYSGSGRGSHLQKVERRMKHGSGRNYLFYRGSSRRHGWPCGLRRTPCEPE